MGRYAQRQRRGGGAASPPAPPPPAAEIVSVQRYGPDPSLLVWTFDQVVVVSGSDGTVWTADDGSGSTSADSLSAFGPTAVGAAYAGKDFSAGGTYSLTGDPGPDVTSAGGIVSPASGSVLP